MSQREKGNLPNIGSPTNPADGVIRRSSRRTRNEELSEGEQSQQQQRRTKYYSWSDIMSERASGEGIFNLRGTWLTHILIAIALKLLFSSVPGISREASWTLTNLTYNIVTFFFLHWLIGTPIDMNQGEYSGLTQWEQIDDGGQYTPTKKFLTVFPIFLFLLSTHYSRYDLSTFAINLIVICVQIIAKLPSMHGVRLFGINERASLALRSEEMM